MTTADRNLSQVAPSNVLDENGRPIFLARKTAFLDDRLLAAFFPKFFGPGLRGMEIEPNDLFEQVE